MEWAVSMKAIIVTKDGQLTVVENVTSFSIDEEDGRLRIWAQSVGPAFKVDFITVELFQVTR